jgi:glycosyltransferase domain-containing protein
MINHQLSRLTIIIPTYKRQAYALRSMIYWSGLGPAVHVLDGSASPIDQSVLSDLGEDIHYHHLPIGLHERLTWSLQLIRTDYAALLSDDEFFLPEALRRCIDFLDTEPDMVSCGGRCLGFSLHDNGVIAWPGYTQQEGYCVALNDPTERMLHHMHPYTPSTIYSVVKTDVWKRAVGILGHKEFPVYALGELQFELAVSYQGKSRVLQNLMWMRSDENAQLTGTSISLNPENLIWHWWRDSHTVNQRNKFLDIMSNGLASSPAEVSVVKDGVSRAIDAYVNAYGGPTPKSIDGFIAAIKQRIPPEVKQVIKKILHRNQDSMARINAIPLIDAAKAMAATGVAVDFQELANIERIVTDFHKNRVVNR